MKTLKTGIFAIALLAVVSLAACKKNGAAPLSKTSQLTFQAQADNSVANLSASPAAGSNLATNSVISGLTFTGGIANISKFQLEAKRNGVETEIESKNLTNVDLFALSPSIANTTIDTGTYREIEIKLVLLHSSSGAIPLKLTGTFTNSSGTAVPFEFDLNDDVTIKAEAANIHVTSTTDFLALIHLHLGRLEKGVTAADLDTASLTNGTLVISSTSNTTIYNTVLANFGTCGENEFREHHKDGNGNDNNSNGNDHSSDG
jgi:hypothetical protein